MSCQPPSAIPLGRSEPPVTLRFIDDLKKGGSVRSFAVPKSPAEDAPMEIKRSGARPSNPGPAEYFTGAVRVEPLHDAAEPARVVLASVTFEPGARTAWHTHPLGQVLVVTAGVGWAQRWGGPVEAIRPGDVVWFPPGEKHWHGATATSSVTHLAVQERLDGRSAEWLEPVGDEQYRGPG